MLLSLLTIFVICLLSYGERNVVATNLLDDPGDLLHVVSSPTIVGFLLNEFPVNGLVRQRIELSVTHFSDSWWKQRVMQQLSLTGYSLAFNSGLMLPVDEEALDISFTSRAHLLHQGDLSFVARTYVMDTYLVGQTGSAAISDPTLTNVSGVLNLNLTLPLDPLLVGQRSGWACFDEDAFPHNSIDTESAAVYFDPYCKKGNAVPITTTCSHGCHCSVNVSLSCVAALEQFTGISYLGLSYIRVEWNEAIASYYESVNSYVANPDAIGSDLVGFTPGLEHNIIVYRYYSPGSCEFQECLTTSGWRKLVLFDSIHLNVGNQDIYLGVIAYDATGPSSFNEDALHHMYYYAMCHRHPHFSEYVQYNYDPAGLSIVGHKRGFCVQSTNRIINARTTPLYNSYPGCGEQGVAPGWADNYNLGISCQWVDITDEDTSIGGAVTHPLAMVGNPANWLCEGVLQQYPNGTQEWRFTGNYTVNPPWPDLTPQPIDVFACATSPGALNNNVDHVSITNPVPGHGILTSRCLKPHGQIYGPNRDCEFIAFEMMQQCRPGHSVSLHCSIPQHAPPQVLRVCESSIALNTGTACRIMDQQSFSMFNNTLANVVILPGVVQTVQFICPTYRDPVEIGGFYSFYSGAVYNGVDPVVKVDCTHL